VDDEPLSRPIWFFIGLLPLNLPGERLGRGGRRLKGAVKMDNEKTVGILNGLIESCRDGREGFKEAAENSQSPDLKTFFRERSQERGKCVTELEQQVRALGGDPAKGGSAAGALHRAWINIKGSFTGKDDAAILSEAERGEDSAVKSFEEALNEGLPPNIRTLLEREYRVVKNSHDRVKQMRDAKSASAGRK
jgi:uncharacterized protein (TIGR02284 family)